MKNQREMFPRKLVKYHPDFEEVNKGQENLFVVKFGDAGKVFTDPKDYEHFTTVDNGHLFLYCHDEDTIERIKSMEEELRRNAKFEATTGIYQCPMNRLIETYIKNYPERSKGLENV